MLAGTAVAREAPGPSYGIYAYTAREWDPEINLYYYRARYYDPRWGGLSVRIPLLHGACADHLGSLKARRCTPRLWSQSHVF